ncbi:hypothetical protein [Streptomyces sp. NPDC051636]|uniref:hypothetical protein n=1 Tax=Streptomyces sp. NPDC051636 TaxID=3365663 RepID=UPI0037AB85AD
MTDRQRPADVREYPAFVLPPFSPGHRPEPPEEPPPARARGRRVRTRRIRSGDAFWSGVLTAISVTGLVVAIVTFFRTHI